MKSTKYKYKPKTYSSNHGQILDYTDVIPNKITLVDPKTILEKDKPGWIIEINEGFFAQNQYMIVAVKLGENKYRLQTSHDIEGTIVIASLDVLAATQHYYMEKTKANFKKEETEYRKNIIKKLKTTVEELKQKEKTGRPFTRYEKARLEHAERMIANPKKIKYRKAPRVLSENRMTYLQNALYRRNFIAQKWEAYSIFRKELKQKMIDMQIQYEDMLDSYAKGEETSYGENGLKNDLLKSLGVKVKRQNGTEIESIEIEKIKKAITAVYKIYGDIKEASKQLGLKVVHSQKKLMHARKALGIFSKRHNAIGVSSKYSNERFRTILAHEYAHLVDYLVGDKKGYHYDSDNFNGLGYNIAKTFRANMKKPQKSNYQNRTCECFARALEQYFTVQTGIEEIFQVENNTEGNYMENKTFKTRIAPMVDEWLKTNIQLLNSPNNN